VVLGLFATCGVTEAAAGALRVVLVVVGAAAGPGESDVYSDSEIRGSCRAYTTGRRGAQRNGRAGIKPH
jgi:hypothetical protein